jgi:hypothetical protein
VTVAKLLIVIFIVSEIWAGVPAHPIYVTVAKLSAQQPSRERPARADAIDQHGD